MMDGQASVAFAVSLSVLAFELTTRLEARSRIGVALVLQLFIGKGLSGRTDQSWFWFWWIHVDLDLGCEEMPNAKC